MADETDSRVNQPQPRRAGLRPEQAAAPTRARRSRPGRGEALRLQDPLEIRALAHPARMAIIDALASGEELTATECAELTGLTPSATAYHLKFLERYDFAEPAPARPDGRERPWRASGRQRTAYLESSTPAGAAAATAVLAGFLDRSRAVAEEFTAHEHEEPEEWQDVALLGSTELWLTADETRELSATLSAALMPYRGRAAAEHPDGARRVRVTTMVFPRRQH